MINHQLITLLAKPYGIHLISDELLSQISLLNQGILHLFITHTSAALALNENASSDVILDVQDFFTHLVPESSEFRHQEEGQDDMPAHIKSILCHSSLSIPFAHNKLLLGQWQGIYLMEFRKNARPRTVIVSQIV